MSQLKSSVKFAIAVTGIALIALASIFIYYTKPYLENEALQYLFEERPWLIKAFVYGIGGFLILLGVLELLACQCENKCFICLVSLRLTCSMNY